MLTQKNQTFTHLAQKSSDRGFCRLDIVPKFNDAWHYMPSLAHCEITRKRNDVSAHVDQQHPTETNVFIDKSDERAGNQPSALNSRQQKCIGLDELTLGRQFLNQRRDG